MKITIVQIGKTKDSFVEEGLKEYLKRLQAFCHLETVTLKESKGQKSRQQHIEDEAETILKTPEKYPDHYKFLLGIEGKNPSSMEFSEQMKKVRDHVSGKALFLVGGPYGVSQRVVDACDTVLSFGRMTFTHQMIRLLLFEQIYRAFTIIEGKDYHY